MKVIFYWSPFLTKIATIKAVINSAASISKYEKNSRIYILNSSGEWNRYYEILKKKEINVINLIKFDLHKFLPKKGYLSSRFSLLIISLVSFIPLVFVILKYKPDYFVSHLNTAFTMFLSNFFNSTKFVLRVSGFPRLHLLRRFIWKKFSKKLYKIIVPTLKTKDYLEKTNIFKNKEIVTIYDPIFSYKDLKKIHFKKKNFLVKNLLAIGRLTKQKNFEFLVECFYEINKKYPNQFILNILGEGEKFISLKNLILKLNLENNVILHGYKKNVEDYYINSNCFILTSLWEDPGFVIVEANFYGLPVISSDCPNGPAEILKNGENGFLFKNNNKKDFLRVFYEFLKTEDQKLNRMRLAAKKNSIKFSSFRHYNKIKKILI